MAPMQMNSILSIALFYLCFTLAATASNTSVVDYGSDVSSRSIIGIGDNVDSLKLELSDSAKIENAVLMEQTTDEFVWSLDENAKDSASWIGSLSVGFATMSIAVIVSFFLGSMSNQRALQLMVVFGITKGVLSRNHCALSFSNTCCLYDASVKCWGTGSWGGNGNGDTATMYGPNVSIDFGTSFIPRELAAGGYHFCAVSTFNESKCWGRNNYGQLGQGHSDNIGNDADEMGDDLLAIDWGTGFVASHIACGTWHTCAVDVVNGTIKCCGYNNYGQLGTGDGEWSIGNAADEMGDYLVAADVGGTPLNVMCGGYHSCAILDTNDLKCWGENEYYGQLGYGDNVTRGNGADQMGDNLGVVDLGTDFEIESVSCGSYHSCAVSIERDLKCWGHNGYGQLGLGDTNDRGLHSEEMGDGLSVVDLGSGFEVKLVVTGDDHTTVISTNGTVKAFGRNYYGQLGYGNTNTVGDGAGEMGDYLDAVNLGTGFNATGMAANDHSCAWDEHYDAFSALKCWGRNDYAQLGYDDKSNRGDGANEMGDNLPFVDTEFTTSPTAEPTADPTSEPTDPTVEPSEEPTSFPSVEPTNEPTIEPTDDPTAEPTTEAPTEEPTYEPTLPSEAPTAEPTSPTEAPTEEPTTEPSTEPTNEPSMPTSDPTNEPTMGQTSASIDESVDSSPSLYPLSTPLLVLLSAFWWFYGM